MLVEIIYSKSIKRMFSTSKEIKQSIKIMIKTQRTIKFLKALLEKDRTSRNERYNIINLADKDNHREKKWIVKFNWNNYPDCSAEWQRYGKYERLREMLDGGVSLH